MYVCMYVCIAPDKTTHGKITFQSMSSETRCRLPVSVKNGISDTFEKPGVDYLSEHRIRRAENTAHGPII